MKKNNKLKKNFLFTAKFAVIFSVLQYLILGLPLQPILNFMAEIQGVLTGEPVISNALLINGVKYIITNSCTGLISSSILAAIIFSLNKPCIKKKMVILLAGTSILLLLNIVRIFFVLKAAQIWNVEIAENLHILSWYLMSAAILVLWYNFTKKITNTTNFSELL